MISSVAWRDLVDVTIAEITARSRPTIIVGGTRSMVEATLFTPTFAPLSEPERAYLSTLPAPELSDIARTMGVSRPLLASNPSALVTAIDQKRTADMDYTLRYPGLLLRTPSYPANVLRDRVIQRTSAMLDAGLVDEVLQICATTGRTPDEISSIGYRELAGLITPAGLADTQLPTFIQRVTTATLDYAARQDDWLSTLPALITLQHPTDALPLLPEALHPNR
jgi:tRNA A37 N6-isopentenylltransferase MiaA